MEISVIIVSWNTKDLLRQCLSSVTLAIKRYNHEIYVIDNASNDGSVDMVRSEFPKIKLIMNDSNLGFASANNQALRLINAKYALLLNPDTILSQECLMKLHTFAEQNPKAGAVAPKLLNPDGSLQDLGRGNFPTIRRTFNHAFFLNRFFPRSHFFEGKTQSRNPMAPLQVDWVAGTCMLLRRKSIEDVGMFDERIFMYGEDVELCWRFHQNGWKSYYHPTATLVHYGSQSFLKQDSAFLRTKMIGWSNMSDKSVVFSVVERALIISGLLLRICIYYALYIVNPKPTLKQKCRLLWKFILTDQQVKRP